MLGFCPRTTHQAFYMAKSHKWSPLPPGITNCKQSEVFLVVSLFHTTSGFELSTEDMVNIGRVAIVYATNSVRHTNRNDSPRRRLAEGAGLG